jgi:protein SCO1
MNRRIALAVCALAMITFTRPAAAQQTFVVDTTLVAAGKKVFAAKACLGCHTIGKGDLAAPDLGGLLERRTETWVQNWLTNPTAMLESDDIAKGMMKRYNNMRMPNLKLTREEIVALIHYIENESRAMRPGGSETQ